MNEALARVRASFEAMLAKRSNRERWILLAAAAGLAIFLVQTLFVSPLKEAAAASNERAEQLEGSLQRAARLAPQLQRLEGEIEAVAGRIQSSRETDLLGVLQDLAQRAQIADRLEKIDPKSPSRNDRFPESRVEVQLRSVTLEQAVQFLYSIDSAPLYLIVRSVKITARKDGSNLLDVNFFVSSFQRA